MPCNSDHMEPSTHEKESKRVALCLGYALTMLGRPSSDRLDAAADSCYGDVKFLNYMTHSLCELCKEMSPHQQRDIIYNGRDPASRRLADWWDEHQDADTARIAKEQESIRTGVNKNTGNTATSTEETNT